MGNGRGQIVQGRGGRETDSPSSSAKTAQDARQFFIWRFGGPAKDHIAQLELEMCVKTAQDDRHFCSGVVCGCFDDRIALRAPKVHYCCHYYLYETVSFSVKSHLFANTKLCTIVVFVFCGSADDRMTIRARSVPKNSTGLSPILLLGCLAFLRLCIRPRVGLGPQMPVKTEQNARDLCIGRFCGSDNDRIAQSDQ